MFLDAKFQPPSHDLWSPADVQHPALPTRTGRVPEVGARRLASGVWRWKGDGLSVVSVFFGPPWELTYPHLKVYLKMDFLPFPVWWDVFFFRFLWRGIRWIHPNQGWYVSFFGSGIRTKTLIFHLTPILFSLPSGNPKKKNFEDQKPLRPPTQVNPSPPPPKWWHKKWDASIRKIPIRSPP